jgi:hypothetical protein
MSEKEGKTNGDKKTNQKRRKQRVIKKIKSKKEKRQ